MAREAKKSGIRWRLWLTVAALAAVCVAAGEAAFKLHQYAMTDSRFTLSPDKQDAIAIEGLRYASRPRILRVFAADFGSSVFAVPLAERRRRLLAIDWVADASVSRIWPDRLMVRIRERSPVAFATLPSGPLLVDSDGVLLDPPARAQFAFPVLNGLREQDSDAQRRERVRAYLQLERELGAMANDVSEVDVSDPENVRVVARVGGRALELLMGGSDFATRYRNFLDHSAEILKQSPDAGTFDLRLDDRITARK